MSFSRLSQGVGLLAVCFFAGAASAANFSFTGSFTTDDQLQDIVFSLSSPATITTVTFGYAGGTNQAGTLIPQGGFDPYLSIFDAGGSLVAVNDDGTCGQVPADSVTGACFDSYISETLSAGTYTLILSQSGNQPFDNTLADGFTQTGQTNFTAMNGCSNEIFCDINADNRTGFWAVDIDNVDSASLPGSAVPEPASVLLAAAGLVAILSARSRARRNRANRD